MEYYLIYSYIINQYYILLIISQQQQSYTYSSIRSLILHKNIFNQQLSTSLSINYSIKMNNKTSYMSNPTNSGQTAHTGVNNLLDHLQSLYTINRNANMKTNTNYNQYNSHDRKKKSHSQNPMAKTLNQTNQNHQLLISKESNLTLPSEIQQQSRKQEMSKLFRHPWKSSGLYHQRDTQVKRLPARDLDNWQIHRINMSKRSYQCPKNYKGIKIPTIGKQFIKYDCKDKDGHMPYLYESDIGKIKEIREKIYTKPFMRTNTVKHQLFGFPQKQRPKSLAQFQTQNSNKLLKNMSSNNS